MLLLRALLHRYPRQARSLDLDWHEPWHCGHLLRHLASPVVSSPRATPYRRATSDMFALSSKLSATICAFSPPVHRRRRRFPVIDSTRRYAPSSCVASSMAFAIAGGYRAVRRIHACFGAPRCCRNASRRCNLALRASNPACSAFNLACSFFSAAYCARNLAISRSASSCSSSSGASISPLSQIRACGARALTRPESIGDSLGGHQKTRLCHKITSIDNSRRIISSI